VAKPGDESADQRQIKFGIVNDENVEEFVHVHFVATQVGSQYETD
jgi:hypothetical protein